MKTIAALIAGLLLSLMTFVAGLALALTFLNAGEPDHRLDGQNIAALWPAEPVAVDKAAQSFERLPARPVPKADAVAAVNKPGSGAKAVKSTALAENATTENPLVDPATTSSIEDQRAEIDASAKTWRTTAHADWCSRRYRSYDAADNSYRPYGGGRRACQSPYSTVAAADTPADTTETGDIAVMAPVKDPVNQADLPEMEQASLDEAPGDYVDGDHVRSCFERYRSYRPEDNTYQPFDGGPRRQCR